MTKNDFQQECNQRTLDVSLVLENVRIRKALANRDDEMVIKYLDNLF